MRFHYYRCSTSDQSIEAQRAALGACDMAFSDEGVSGATLAAARPGFAALLAKLRPGDTLVVYALDRLGRDALDVQSTVRRLIRSPNAEKPEDRGLGITVEIHGLGVVGEGVGEIIVAVLSQVGDLERRKIKERCDAGRTAARASLAETGRTHRGKVSLGRPQAAEAVEVRAWRSQMGASISATAKHFGISAATVSRYCAVGRTEAEEAASRRNAGWTDSRTRLAT